MEAVKLEFGLSDSILGDVRGVLADYPEIEKVLIFGSRAKNTFKDGSDINLAVFAQDLSEPRFTELWNKLDALPLVFKMDILHWDKLGNEHLKDKITKEGKVLYYSYFQSYDLVN